MSIRRRFIALALAGIVTTARGAEISVTNALRGPVADFHAAYRAWDGEAFTQIATNMAAIAAQHPASTEAQLWSGIAWFHLATHNRSSDTKAHRDRAGAQLSRAIRALQTAVALDRMAAEAHALISTATGMQIADNPRSALWRAGRLTRHRDLALKTDPDNPRIHYLVGTTCFHGPALLGGKERALKHFLKAEKLFAAESDVSRGPIESRWGYGSCLTMIGRTYVHQGNPEAARRYLRAAFARNAGDTIARDALEKLEQSMTEKSQRGTESTP